MDYKQSFEELEENFLRELMKSNKLLEAISKMETKYTTEEMFYYIWSLDEAHRFLTPVLLPSSKSKDSSRVYCRQGDIAYKLCNLDKALKLYNLAILSAPHPAIMTGNSFFDNNTKDTVKQLYNEVYDDLAQAYESRSVLLFDMEQYGKCSNDIDRALELECLQASQRNKLLEMKDRCQKMSSKGKAKAMSVSAMAFNSSQRSFAYVNPKPPKLAECNPAIPSFSSAVKLAYSHSQGRHMIANRDIIPVCYNVFTVSKAPI
nr:uncharacterized protein LOC128693654 [Cherax quadricarinatus]